MSGLKPVHERTNGAGLYRNSAFDAIPFAIGTYRAPAEGFEKFGFTGCDDGRIGFQSRLSGTRRIGQVVRHYEGKADANEPDIECFASACNVAGRKGLLESWRANGTGGISAVRNATQNGQPGFQASTRRTG
jgi:hypothetical protein